MMLLIDQLVCLQERAGAGAARAAHEGERDGGAGELQHLRQPLGHRPTLLRLHPKTGDEQAYALRTARVESWYIAGLDYFWSLFFKPVFGHWLGGVATPISDSQSSNPVMRQDSTLAVLNAHACFLG